MRKSACIHKPTFVRAFALLFLLAAPALIFAQASYKREELSQHEEITKPAKLNNKNFQANLEKYGHELDLTSRQVKKLNRIERKYNRKERKIARNPETKRRHLKAVQKEKREQMIAVLDYEQQQKLQQLSKSSKSNFWDFVRLRN